MNILRPRPCADPGSRNQGVTLIELMIALAVVAILSAIAWPGYGAVLHRAQRIDARLALLRLQHLQESHYATHLRYADRLGETADADVLAMTGRSAGGHYLLSITATADAQGYTATARASADGRQRRDHGCQQLTIDETGRQRSADASGNWSEANAQRCWG